MTNRKKNLNPKNPLKIAILKSSNKKRAILLQRFFKTGLGQYGEGDVFAGLTVPQIRKISKNYSEIPLSQIASLLQDEVHEVRFAALVILCMKYKSATTENLRKQIFHFYIRHSTRVNNWDLVDTSAPCIVGNYLFERKVDSDGHRSNSHGPSEINILYTLARSKNIWQKRIAIVSTIAFIRCNNFDHTLKIAQILLQDEHDLIHKAVGWMLREVGKKNMACLEKFLNQKISSPKILKPKSKTKISLYKIMPRTMLRYAIEKFPHNLRLRYLSGKI